MREIDRSRIIAAQTCPRSRWLGYEIFGKGLQRIRKSLPLQFGSAFHEGAELLLAGDVEGAVQKAHQFLTEQFEAQQIGFDGETPTDVVKAMEYGREEQIALAEALIRGWAAFEMESFLDAFEVIEVEREGRATLKEGMNYNLLYSLPANDAQKAEGIESVDYYSASGSGEELVLLFRPDALVREKASGDLFVVSWKTCATFGKRNVDQSRHDQQSISEVWGIQNAQCEDEGCDHHGTSHGCNNPKKIEGVLYKWIVKGRRTLDDWDGLYKQDSPLIYGWMKLGQSPEDADWSWKYSWSDPDEVNEKTGRAVGHKLGKGWKKVPIWREYPGGVKQWIADLAAQRINPRHQNALESTFPQATPVERRADEVQSWKRQIIHQELDIANKIKTVEAADEESRGEILDLLFPQYSHSCHSYSGCSFIPICWEGVKAEPGELYQIRVPNHVESKEEEC